MLQVKACGMMTWGWNHPWAAESHELYSAAKNEAHWNELPIKRITLWTAGSMFKINSGTSGEVTGAGWGYLCVCFLH